MFNEGRHAEKFRLNAAGADAVHFKPEMFALAAVFVAVAEFHRESPVRTAAAGEEHAEVAPTFVSQRRHPPSFIERTEERRFGARDLKERVAGRRPEARRSAGAVLCDWTR